jgi:Domain of unknown function (DUF5615)
MLLLAADENFNNNIVRGLRRRNPAIDIVRIQDARLKSASDPDVLEWAAQSGRVLFTHDVSTMTRHAHDRVKSGKPMPGVFEVGRQVPVRVAIEEIELIAECSFENVWVGQVRYLPLR